MQEWIRHVTVTSMIFQENLWCSLCYRRSSLYIEEMVKSYWLYERYLCTKPFHQSIQNIINGSIFVLGVRGIIICKTSIMSFRSSTIVMRKKLKLTIMITSIIHIHTTNSFKFVVENICKCVPHYQRKYFTALLLYEPISFPKQSEFHKNLLSIILIQI